MELNSVLLVPVLLVKGEVQKIWLASYQFWYYKVKILLTIVKTRLE